ncbi:MAG: ABC transporter substrate-binding protein [Deltaproteobacteria bacterium]|nr:ABC transporter substrate-binding protein [Deltaproteobacteria bacterium]
MPFLKKKNRMTLGGRILVVLLCLLPLTARADKKVVKIGFIADITGAGFLIALAQKNALELAAEEINSTGGLLGRRVELMVRDSQLRPDLGAALAQEMITRDKVDFILGPTSPSVALAVSRVCRAQKKLLALHGANNERLINEEGHRYVFQVIPSTYMEGQAVAAFVSKKPYKKIMIIGPELEYGHSQAEAFKKKIAELNPAVAVVKEFWPRLGEPDYTPYIAAVLSTKPDAVYSILWGGDLASFLRQALPHGVFQKTQFISPIDYDLLKGLGNDMIAGLHGFDRAPFYAMNNPLMKAFLNKYKNRTGEFPSAWAVMAYDSLMAIRKAAEKAKSLDTEKVIDALGGLSWDSLRGPLKIRPQDHLANAGLFFGTTAKDPQYSFYVMKDVVYFPGHDFWPPTEETKSPRK